MITDWISDQYFQPDRTVESSNDISSRNFSLGIRIKSGFPEAGFKSIQNVSDMKTARTVDFSTNSGYPTSGEGGI